LYPDSLLSQVFVAATYPLEIAEADQWLKHNSNLQGTQLVEAARQQNWDPSIQALVVFPDVLSRLNADIRWTTDLGNTFLAQQADVMNAVQRMRAQAKEAGKLQSTAQETVTTERQGDKSVIVIQPANPEVVYVPHYNPEYIWGPPLYGYYPAWDYPYFGFGFGFGPGIYIGGFFGGLGWGSWGWWPNWYHCSIYQNHYFFNHYGYGGHGYRGDNHWAHDPGHRMGVRYSNSAVSQRYGGYSTTRGGFSGSRFGGQFYGMRQHDSSPRSNAVQTGGWSRFGQAGVTSQSGLHSDRSTQAHSGSRGTRTSPSYGDRYGGNRTVPSSRSSPSYGNSGGFRTSPSYSENRSVPSFRSSPSYGNSGGYRSSPSYGGNRTMPSYRSSPSTGGGGGSQSSRSSFSGGGSSHSGGSSHGSGGRR
jgi:hypothetical protein